MRTIGIAILGLSLFFAACSHNDSNNSCPHKNNNDTCKKHSDDNEHLAMAVLYQQTAAEARALQYQAYNLARLMLDEDMKRKGDFSKRAIIADIDETLLDNSPYEAKCVVGGISYPQEWDNWCNKASAKAIPGALEFMQYAASKGYQIFYVSNRSNEVRQATMKNLKDIGFPMVDDEHILLKTTESSKEARRQQLMKNYEIVLLIGDNMVDFTDLFAKKSSAERLGLADSLKHHFGNKFIVLPNAMYGDWEAPLYDYNHDRKPEEKRKLRHQNLIGF